MRKVMRAVPHTMVPVAAAAPFFVTECLRIPSIPTLPLPSHTPFCSLLRIGGYSSTGLPPGFSV
jgi:hypothetical protein